MAVLCLSMGNLRCGILAGLSIPLSASAAFIVLALSGSSLNSMSLSGIALGIGLVSDTSVIIIDLLCSSVKAGGRQTTKNQRDRISAAAASVAASGFGGTLTTAVVFFPILFLPGPLGSLFRDLAAALMVSVSAGWIYAQFALPGLFALLHEKSPIRKKGKTSWEKQIRRWYEKNLGKTMKRPFPVFASAGLLSALGIFLLIAMPAVFVSPDGITEIEVRADYPAGTRLESIGPGAAAVARTLEDMDEYALVFGRAGAEDENFAGRADPSYRKETLSLRCILKPGADAGEALEKTRRLIDGGLLFSPLSPAAAFSAGYPADGVESILGLSSGITVAVTGKDREELSRRLAGAEESLLDSGYCAGLSVRPSEKREEIRLYPRREAAAYAGISAAETAQALYAATRGFDAGDLEIDGKQTAMKVASLPDTVLDIGMLPVASVEGNPILLSSLARIERREAESVLFRLDRGDAAYIEARALPGEENKLAAGMADLVDSGGGIVRADQSVFDQYRTALTLTVILVLLLLYFSMGAEFESFSLPLILMAAIPFSLAGAGPALFLSGGSLDSSSVLGLAVLFGLAVNGGMVLYERAKEKQAQGLCAQAAVYEAARDRQMPVLTTALTTVFALCPLTFSPLGAGQRSMAVTMLGGVAASTLLTLFALPPVFARYLGKGKGLTKQNGGSPVES
jgi:multidrug efflux pump subunit AcrB